MKITVVGVTGHSNITNATAKLVHEEFLRLLRPVAENLNGMTCLARGADQTFADAVTLVGGTLTIVIPAEDYFDGILTWADGDRCRRYLDLAKSKVSLPNKKSNSKAYLDASRYLVDNCDVLYAVWDGSAAGTSGTADAVEYARHQGKDVIVIWPDGAARKKARP